jgi:hypothetical protein
MDKTPKAFISSTIYDFQDLRSSLKWYLEKSGFQVLTSESNDFPVEQSVSSYDACLKAIQNTDVFILLIGFRVGGMYDKKNRISITRQEYREAKAISKQRPLQIITIVRNELWVIKEDRKALKKLISKLTADQKLEPGAEKLTYHPSKFADDAKTILSFIDEVSQKQEMKEASAGKGDYPENNWINQFSSFEDIVQTLETRLDLKSNLNFLVIRHRLKRETLYNLKLLYMRSNDSTIPLVDLSGIRQKLPSSMNSHIKLNQDECLNLFMFLTESSTPANYFRTDAITEAISEGTFLEWDSMTSSIIETELNEALLWIKENIDEARYINNALRKQLFDQLMRDTKDVLASEVQDCSIEGYKLVFPILLSERFENLKLLLRYIYSKLSSKSESFDFTKLYTERNPFPEQNSRLVKTQISDVLMDNFVIGEKNPEWLVTHFGQSTLDRLVQMMKDGYKFSDSNNEKNHTK